MEIYQRVAAFYHEQFNSPFGKEAKRYVLEEMGVKYVQHPEKVLSENLIGCKGRSLVEAFPDEKNVLVQNDLLVEHFSKGEEMEMVINEQGVLFPIKYGEFIYYFYAYNPSSMVLRHQRSWHAYKPVFNDRVIFTEGEKEAFLIRALGFSAFPLLACRTMFYDVQQYRDHFTGCTPYFHVEGNDPIAENMALSYAKSLLSIDVESKMIYCRDTTMMHFLRTHKEQSSDIYASLIQQAKYPLASLF